MGGLRGKIGLMAASFSMMSFFVVNSVLADISQSFPDVPVQTVQMITTMPNLVALVVALIVGKITPYIHKRTLILVSKGFYIVGGIFPYFFHQNVACILFGAGVVGIGLGIMLTCVAALICDCYNEKESGMLMGFQAAMISGGGMLFLWFGGQLGKDHWENVFLAYLFIIVIFVIEFFCLPKGKLDAKTEKGAEGIDKRDHKSEKRTAGAKGGRIPAPVWFYALVGFFFFIFLTLFNTGISMFVDSRQLGGPEEASYASMCYTFTGLVVGCLSGILIQKLKEYIFVVASALTCAGMLIIYFSGGLGLVFLGGALCGAAFAVFNPAGNFFASKYAGENNRSLCIAIYSSVSSLGQALSPIIIGFIFRPFDIEQRFLWSGVALALVAAATFLGIRGLARMGKPHEEKARRA